MSIKFTTINLPGTTIYPSNPTVDIKNVAYIHAGFKTSKSCEENKPQYFGEGMVDSMLPYLQQDHYSTSLKEMSLNVAVLENDYLKATILTDFGGRLYSLYDKQEQRELLYKNEVFKICNLSLLNAWFSGGVEWNVSIKGHNPLTCSKMFVSTIKVGEDTGIRVYEYERKRRVCYSIDFILPENSKFLYVLPTIENTENVEKYNYWWSNIAVPEHRDTRVIVPAKKSYISSYNKNAYFIDYLDVPNIDGRDTSYPNSSPCSNDYFYKIDDTEEKWIASIEGNGKGLVQASTKLLKGRKMFVWGNSEGGTNWQNLLSDNKEHYTEIQAGLAETQLQHIKMKPNSKLEWVEVYGGITLNIDESHNKDFNVAINAVKNYLNNYFKNGVDNTLSKMLDLKRETIEVNQVGSGWGAFENIINKANNLLSVSNYLTFADSTINEEQTPFLNLIKNGYMAESDINKCPISYEITDYMKDLLLKSLNHKLGYNWTSLYQLGTTYYGLNNYGNAYKYWLESYNVLPNAWAARNLAMYFKNIVKDNTEAYEWIMKAYRLSKEFFIIKDTAITLNDIGCYNVWIDIFNSLPDEFKTSGRLQFYKAFALNRVGRNEEASHIINYDFFMHDVREGEISVSDLWYKIYGALLLKDYNNLSEKEVIKQIDILMPLKNQDFRMHK